MSDPDAATICVASKPCGCVTVAAVADETDTALAARETARAIRRGEQVESMTVGEFRQRPTRCDEHRQTAHRAQSRSQTQFMFGEL